MSVCVCGEELVCVSQLFFAVSKYLATFPHLSGPAAC